MSQTARVPTTPRPASCSLFGFSSIAAIFLCDMGFAARRGAPIAAMRENREGALVTVFRRYLAHGLALPGCSPNMGEAETACAAAERARVFADGVRDECDALRENDRGVAIDRSLAIKAAILANEFRRSGLFRSLRSMLRRWRMQRAGCGRLRSRRPALTRGRTKPQGR